MKKIYIEISDICGLKCDFCPAPKGVRGVMDLATFKKAILEARRFTRLIALHILGDPLKIENLAEYLKIAKEANLSVEITTSGANLNDFDLLLRSPIKQVNFSLDAIKSLKNAPFLMRRICDFCAYKVQKKSEIFINLRIQKRAENREIIEFLAQNLGKLNPCEAPLNSPASWCKKSESKGAEVPPADFLLEAEKRGSPPKSEKRSFWRVGGAGRGVQPFCEKESSEISGKGFAESIRDLQGGLPRRFCESARNDEFLDSSLRKCSAQNDNFGVRVAESALDSANLQNLAQNRIKLGNKIIIDFRDVFKWQVDSANQNNPSLRADSQNLRGNPKDLRALRSNHPLCEKSQNLQSRLPRSLALARNDNFNRFAESRLDSALSTLSTQEANSAIADEFLGFCETSDEDRTLVHRGSELKQSLKSRCESKFAEFGTCLALKTHLGILADGTIIPCCIDISGNLALGNIKEISLDSALKSTRAQKMLQGFRENRLIEPFCQKCDYKNRFT